MSGRPQRKNLKGKEKEGSGGNGGVTAAVVNPPAPSSAFLTTEDVTNRENAIVSSLELASRTGVILPSRPAYSAQGTGISMKANYFNLALRADLVLYQYSITIEPIPKAEDRAKGKMPRLPVGKKVKQIIHIMLEKQGFKSSKDFAVTDFKANLITSRQLPLEGDLLKIQIDYRAENESMPGPSPQKYNILLHSKPNFPLLQVKDLSSFLASVGDLRYPDRFPMVQAMNIMLGHPMKSSRGIVTVGANKGFSVKDQKSKELGGGLIASPGYFMSARLATSRTLLNVNITHSAFYSNVRLDKIMDAFGLGDLIALQTFLKGRRVTTNHLTNDAGQKMARIKTIAGLANNTDGQELKDSKPAIGKVFGAGPKDVSFKLKDAANSSEKNTTVLSFFQERYNIVASQKYPVVNVGKVGKKENPIYLPAEACTVLPGQVFQSALNQAQTAAMTKLAVQFPKVNKLAIEEEGLKTLMLNPDPLKFNMDRQMIDVQGRRLLPPSIVYKDGKARDLSNGKWNLSGAEFVQSDIDLKNWASVALTGSNAKVDKSVISNAVNKFRDALTNTGITASQPAEEYLRLNRYDDGTIKNLFSKLQLQGAKFLLVILPTRDTSLYGLVKRLGDRDVGIPTVCVVGDRRKFYKLDADYNANVAMKFNLKLNGVNQTLSPGLPIISGGDTMVVGIDVTHPTGTSVEDAPSVAAMVASVDRTLAQWPAVLQVQVQNRLEMLTQAGEMLMTRLELWFSKNNSLPAKILIYRDGVSEGQYQQVLDVELKRMQDECVLIYQKKDKPAPKFTLVIVGKRHHTRFFPAPKTIAGDTNGNPKHGTLVDRHVTEARTWDFFLQSHAAILGTARPAHYVVLWDEIFSAYAGKAAGYNNAAECLHHVTHHMCYLYGRATVPVSIPPPVYYADIACERARCYLSSYYEGLNSPNDETDEQRDTRWEGVKAVMQRDITVHPRLADTMFYI